MDVVKVKHCIIGTWGFLGDASGEELACQRRRHKRLGFDPWAGQITYRRAWQPTPVFLPGEFHGQRSLVGYSPWDCKSQTQLKHLSMHTPMVTLWETSCFSVNNGGNAPLRSHHPALQIHCKVTQKPNSRFFLSWAVRTRKMFQELCHASPYCSLLLKEQSVIPILSLFQILILYHEKCCLRTVSVWIMVAFWAPT